MQVIEETKILRCALCRETLSITETRNGVIYEHSLRRKKTTIGGKEYKQISEYDRNIAINSASVQPICDNDGEFIYVKLQIQGV